MFARSRAGADAFRYTVVSESTPGARDTIRDFSQAAGDVIDLSSVDTDAGTAGDQAFLWLGTGAFNGTAGAVRYVQGGTTMVEADLDGDNVADFQIALTGSIALNSNDFIL